MQQQIASGVELGRPLRYSAGCQGAYATYTSLSLMDSKVPDCQGTLKDTCPKQDGCAYRGSSGCYPQCSVLQSETDCGQGGQWCQWTGSSCEQTPCNQLVQSACYDSMYCAWNNDKRTCEGKSLANIAGNVTFV